jgi:4-hydroxy-2-oxoheptanedioate aldolase
VRAASFPTRSRFRKLVLNPDPKESTMSLLDQLRAGAILTGMQSFSASPIMLEAMGRAGLDFVTIDMEHCPTGLETLAHLLRAADSGGITAFARVPQLDASIVGRVLDLGVAGFVLPHASVERCRTALDLARYAPEGSRSACPMIRAAGYMPKSWPEFASAANRDTLVIPLIEDAKGLDECEAILDLKGVDIVFVGPFDLSMSLGLAGADYKHPQMAQALERIVKAASSRGKFVMTTVASTIDHGYASLLLERGVTLLSFSADVGVFFAACRGIASLGRAAAAR